MHRFTRGCLVLQNNSKIIRYVINTTRCLTTVESNNNSPLDKMFPVREEFPKRHIGPREHDIISMLDFLGFKILTMPTKTEAGTTVQTTASPLKPAAIRSIGSKQDDDWNWADMLASLQQREEHHPYHGDGCFSGAQRSLNSNVNHNVNKNINENRNVNQNEHVNTHQLFDPYGYNDMYHPYYHNKGIYKCPPYY